MMKKRFLTILSVIVLFTACSNTNSQNAKLMDQEINNNSTVYDSQVAMSATTVVYDGLEILCVSSEYGVTFMSM